MGPLRVNFLFRSICLNDGKVFAAYENDVLCIDLESGKKQTVKIPGYEFLTKKT